MGSSSPSVLKHYYYSYMRGMKPVGLRAGVRGTLMRITARLFVNTVLTLAGTAVGCSLS